MVKWSHWSLLRCQRSSPPKASCWVRLLTAAHENVEDWPLAPQDWPLQPLRCVGSKTVTAWNLNKHPKHPNKRSCSFGWLKKQNCSKIFDFTISTGDPCLVFPHGVAWREIFWGNQPSERIEWRGLTNLLCDLVLLVPFCSYLFQWQTHISNQLHPKKKNGCPKNIL